MPSFNKSSVAYALSHQTGFSHSQSVRQIDALIEIIKQSLQRGDAVKIHGFGQFIVRPRASRKSRNPRTGEEIVAKASKTPVFLPSVSFKKYLNGEAE